MKNKVIISLVFLLPLVVYFVLSAFAPQSSFEQVAFAESKLPRVLYFSTPMCGECKKFAPIVEQAQNEYKGKVEFYKVNAVENTGAVNKLVKKYKIYVVPTVIYLNKEGDLVSRSEGYLSYREFQNYLKDIE